MQKTSVSSAETGDFMNNLHMSEILSSKYDVHLDYQITMYDQLPYKRNADLCGEQNIAMYSGHVIKYYMCDNILLLSI